MCLLSFSYRMIAECPVLLLANREEEYARPTTGPRQHAVRGHKTSWMGGVDLRSGGTWLGVNQQGMIAAITNRPEPAVPANPRSRGLLCTDVLSSRSIDRAIAHAMSELSRSHYAGCNLLLATSEHAVVIESADQPKLVELERGNHALTNGNINDTNDARNRRVLSTWKTHSAEDIATGNQWIATAQSISRSHRDERGPSLCIHDPIEPTSSEPNVEGSYGTVSSTIVAVHDQIEQCHYLFASGPPCSVPFNDVSGDFRQMLAGRRPPHRVRLMGPWKYEWLRTEPAGGQVPTTQAGSLKLPCSWQSAFGTAAGEVRFRRRFGMPANLDANERVSIVIDGLGGTAQVEVNNVVLGTIEKPNESAAFDITELLVVNNELVIDIAFDPRDSGEKPGGLFCPIAIEIYEQS